MESEKKHMSKFEPKLWRHPWRNFRFCKSCRTAMRFHHWIAQRISWGMWSPFFSVSY